MTIQQYKLLTLGTLILASFTSCEDDKKKEDAVVTPEPVSRSYMEEFEDCSSLSEKGWVLYNNSNPVGPTGWRQGKFEIRFDSKNGQTVDGFPAYSPQSAQTDFISCDLNAGSGVSTLSAWLVTPIRPLKNGDQFTFWARSKGEFPDRMEVRGNFNNSSANVGKSDTDVGDFTTLLREVNPGLTATGFPAVWTKYTITLANLPAPLVNGRIAIRYFVPNGGPSGANSDMIGIDAFEFISK
jgi:hypothetical protein